MKSKSLKVFLAAALVLTMMPVAAYADVSDDAAAGSAPSIGAEEGDSAAPPDEQVASEEDELAAPVEVPGAEIGETAESWRFSDGYPSNYLREYMEDSGIALMGAFSDVEDGYRATWKNSNGVMSYIYRKNPNDPDTTVVVPGALEAGVDISYYNNNGVAPIDWRKMRADGITFAIIRAADGSTTEAGFVDPWFVRNIQGAKAAGLKVGVYLYSRALTHKGVGKQTVDHEVNLVLGQMKLAGYGPDDLELPVYLDLEDSCQRKLKPAVLAKVAEEFCGRLQAKGYQVGIYSNQDWFNNVLTDPIFSVEKMRENQWSRWVARYSWGSSSSGVAATDIWQFTSIGTVAGTPRKYCDMNFSFVPFGTVPQTSTVTYQLNGGTLRAPNPVSYTGMLKLPTPSRAYYRFDGWFTDKALTKKVTTLTSANATVYAKWSQPYKVTYKLNGGKNHASNPSKYGGTFTLKTPTRAGCTFAGWYTDAAFKNKVTKLTNKTVTLYAKWNVPHKITYKLNGGKNSKSNPAKAVGTVKLKNPTRSGYTFGGWYTNKKFTAKSKVTKLSMTKNRTVYARWYKNRKITYKLNGGKNNKANPSKYGGTLTLKRPTRAGYTFVGWYTNKKFTAKSKVTKLSVTKNRTVYARWKKNTAGTYRVNASAGLNIRKKASTASPVTGALANKQKVRVNKVSGTWGRLADGRGWISLTYAVKL